MSVNRGAYRTFEGEVYNYVPNKGTVSVRVDFYYKGNSKVPSAIRYRVWSGGKSPALKKKFKNF